MPKIRKFKVQITETLQATVEVTTKDKDTAITKVQNMYGSEDIVLTADDFVPDAEFEIVK